MPILPPKQPIPKPNRADAGFSLLEVIVVMAIMAIMMSLVGTRIVNTIESNRFIRTAEAAIADVLIVRADAMLNGEARRMITLSADPDLLEENGAANIRRFDVPANWRVEGDIIEISPSGVCNGGFISMSAPDGRKIVFSLSPPKCEPARVSLGTDP